MKRDKTQEKSEALKSDLKTPADYIFGALSLFNDIKDGLIEITWPTRCVVCDLPGVLLCKQCERALPWISQKDSCLLCGAPYGRICCSECWSMHGFQPHVFHNAVCALCSTYESMNIVVSYKDHSERRLSRVIAHLMTKALLSSPILCASSELSFRSYSPSLNDCSSCKYKPAMHNLRHDKCKKGDRALCELPFDSLCYIPSTPDAYKKRGFDHMRCIAKELSELLSLPIYPKLFRRNVADQRGLSREERIQNVQRSFSCSDGKYGNVLLVDDVLTTGSTLDAASQVLLNAGASSICVLALCRVW